MNTGAEDDSLSTPIFTFTASSARAIPLAANASRPANASRRNPFIRSPPCLLYTRRDWLIAPDKRALRLQSLLQLFDRDVARSCIARQRQRGGGSGRLPHRKAGAGNPRRGLALMGHRGAAAGDQEIVDA